MEGKVIDAEPSAPITPRVALWSNRLIHDKSKVLSLQKTVTVFNTAVASPKFGPRAVARTVASVEATPSTPREVLDPHQVVHAGANHL